MSWRSISLVLALLSIILVAGCDGGSSSNDGRVAVIDLKQVADQLGRSAALNQTLSATQQELQSKLQQLQEQIQKKVEAEAAALGPVPNPEQVQKLEMTKAGARQFFEQQVQLGQERINRLHVDFAAKMREDVKLVALRVAQQRGRSVVIMKEATIDYDPEADITLAVIQEMKSIGSSMAPPMPPTTAPSSGGSSSSSAPSTQPAGASPFGNPSR